MNTSNSHTQVSKFLSYVLRHKPEAIGLELDAEGWALIQKLIDKADIGLTFELLQDVVRTNDKKRFTISADGKFIRANQGHSINVDLGLKPKAPPEYLYHGTAARFLDRIKREGLLSRSRQYVHLSGDKETAIKVGQRYGKPVVLMIPALAMHKQGHKFFQSQNGVWLATNVPPELVSMLAEE